MRICKQALPFDINYNALSSVCAITDEKQKACEQAQAERKQRRRNYAKALYLIHCDKVKRRSKLYYYRVKDTPQFKAQRRAYYLHNKAKILQLNAEWRRAHIEQVRAISLKSYHKHKEAYRERAREYERTHHARKMELQRQRRANMTAEQRAEYNRKQTEQHRLKRDIYNANRREKRRQAKEQAQECNARQHINANNAEASSTTR